MCNFENTLKADEYVVFDTETTGFKPDINYGQIIEIGAVKIRNNEIVDEFSTFINPGFKIPKKITELTGITDDMVKDCETIFPVLKKFKEFCGNSVLVAHNAKFDISFMEYFYSMKCQCLNTHCDVVDTLELDKKLYPDAPNHKLCTIAERFGIVQEAAHRAIDDARVTAKAFLILKEKYKGLAENNNEFKYVTHNKIVNSNDLIIKRVSDFIKEGKYNINRLYINLYLPTEEIYGSIYYDRIKKEWYNKDFPSGYILNFEEIKKQVLIIRKESVL